MFPAECEEPRINHLTPLLVVIVPYACWLLWRVDYIEEFKWRLHFAIWGCVWKGYFKRGIIWRAKSHLKGIEDFNLEHWVEEREFITHSLTPWDLKRASDVAVRDSFFFFSLYNSSSLEAANCGCHYMPAGAEWLPFFLAPSLHIIGASSLSVGTNWFRIITYPTTIDLLLSVQLHEFFQCTRQRRSRGTTLFVNQ